MLQTSIYSILWGRKLTAYLSKYRRIKLLGYLEKDIVSFVKKKTKTAQPSYLHYGYCSFSKWSNHIFIYTKGHTSLFANSIPCHTWPSCDVTRTRSGLLKYAGAKRPNLSSEYMTRIYWVIFQWTGSVLWLSASFFGHCEMLVIVHLSWSWHTGLRQGIQFDLINVGCCYYFSQANL